MAILSLRPPSGPELFGRPECLLPVAVGEPSGLLAVREGGRGGRVVSLLRALPLSGDNWGLILPRGSGVATPHYPRDYPQRPHDLVISTVGPNNGLPPHSSASFIRRFIVAAMYLRFSDRRTDRKALSVRGAS